MKKTILYTLIGVLGLLSAALASAGTPQGPLVPRVVLQPASQQTPVQFQAISAWSGDLASPRPIGLERTFDQPWVVEIAADRLPSDLPAAYAGGLLERAADGALIWTVRLTVLEAREVRVHLRCFSLPESCRISAHAPGQELPETVNPGMASPEGDLWSALVDGPTALVRVEIPPEAPLQGRFEVAGILEILKPSALAPPQPRQPQPAPEDAAQPQAVPIAPSNLTLTVMGPNSVLCQWQDNSTNETGFKLQRRTGTYGSYYKVAKVPPGVTAYTDPTCAAGQIYTYRVKAVNAEGASGPSNEVVVTAGLPGPFTVTGTTACDGSNPRNYLTWTTSSTAYGYDVYRNGALYTQGVTGTTYTDLNASLGVLYTYYVVAANAYGRTNSNTVAISTISSCCVPPAGPTLTATTGCTGSVSRITLTWTTPSGATSYDVYRNGLLLAPGQVAATYTDSTVTAGLGYNYYVVAKNSCGTGTSNTVVATAPINCCPAPGPFTLVVQPYCYGTPIASGFLLQWTASSGVTASNTYDIYMDGYPIVYYAVQSQAWFIGANPNTLHQFFIRARNSCATTDSNTAAAISPTSCITEFIVDDMDVGHFALYGPGIYWFPVTNSHCYANHMWYTPNETSATPFSTWADWTPAAMAGSPGYYTISAYIPCLAYADTSHAAYYVMYGGITLAAPWVNQAAYCDAWAPLGTFYFHGDGYDYIELGSPTGEAVGTTYVGFDAIRWRQ